MRPVCIPRHLDSVYLPVSYSTTVKGTPLTQYLKVSVNVPSLDPEPSPSVKECRGLPHDPSEILSDRQFHIEGTDFPQTVRSTSSPGLRRRGTGAGTSPRRKKVGSETLVSNHVK